MRAARATSSSSCWITCAHAPLALLFLFGPRYFAVSVQEVPQTLTETCTLALTLTPCRTFRRRRSRCRGTGAATPRCSRTQTTSRCPWSGAGSSQRRRWRLGDGSCSGCSFAMRRCILSTRSQVGSDGLKAAVGLAHIVILRTRPHDVCAQVENGRAHVHTAVRSLCHAGCLRDTRSSTVSAAPCTARSQSRAPRSPATAAPRGTLPPATTAFVSEG